MKQLSVIADPFSLQFASLFRGSPRFCREMLWVWSTSRHREILMDYCGSTEETFCFHEDAWRICPDYRNRPTCIWAIDDRGLPILIGRVMVPYRDMFGDSP